MLRLRIVALVSLLAISVSACVDQPRVVVNEAYASSPIEIFGPLEMQRGDISLALTLHHDTSVKEACRFWGGADAFNHRTGTGFYSGIPDWEEGEFITKQIGEQYARKFQVSLSKLEYIYVVTCKPGDYGAYPDIQLAR